MQQARPFTEDEVASAHNLIQCCRSIASGKSHKVEFRPPHMMPNGDLGHFTSEEGQSFRRILIDETLDPILMAETFAHEIAHVMDPDLNHAGMKAAYRRHKGTMEGIAYYVSMWACHYWGILDAAGGADSFRHRINHFSSYENLLASDEMIHRADRGIFRLLEKHPNRARLLAVHRQLRIDEGRPDSGRGWLGRWIARYKRLRANRKPGNVKAAPPR